jgi:hypothetical protein
MTENEEVYEEIAEEEEDEPQGIIDRIINVFLDPAALFRGLARKPEFWTPVIVIIAVNALLTIVTYPSTKDLRLEAKRQQWAMRITDDDEEERQEKLAETEKKYVEVGRKWEPYTESALGVFVILVYLFVAGVLYLISLIQGLDTSFKRLMSVVTYTSLIALLGNVIDKILKLAGVVTPETMIEWQGTVTGLAYHLPDKIHMAYYMLASLVDPFTIWSMIVMVIGLRFANRCPMRSAIITIIIYLVLLILLMVGMGFLTQMGLDKVAESGGGNVEVRVG